MASNFGTLQKNVSEEYQKLQAEIDALNGLQSGIIRIGTFSSVATHWLPEIFPFMLKNSICS